MTIETWTPLQIPLERLRGRNVRDRLVEHEQELLAESIKQNGILVPCIGYQEGAEVIIVDGFRRIDAARRAGRDTVPMLVADHPPSPAEVSILQLVVNCHRSGIKPMERVRAIDRLMSDSGFSAAEVSRRLVDQSESMISKLLTLLVHPKEVQDLIDCRRIPLSSAYAIATVSNTEERKRLINEVLNGRLTRDRVVAEIKAWRRKNGNPQTRKRAKPRRACVTVPLGKGQWIKVRGQNLTLKVFVEWLEASLNRFRVLEPRDMELGDAFGIVNAGNP